MSFNPVSPIQIVELKQYKKSLRARRWQEEMKWKRYHELMYTFFSACLIIQRFFDSSLGHALLRKGRWKVVTNE